MPDYGPPSGPLGPPPGPLGSPTGPVIDERSGPPLLLVIGVVAVVLVAAAIALALLAGGGDDDGEEVSSTDRSTTTTEPEEEDEEEETTTTTTAPTSTTAAPSSTTAPAPPPTSSEATDLEIVLAWTGEHDLDLVVSGPDGQAVSLGGTSPSGGAHSGDVAASCGDAGAHQEVVTWAGRPPRGGYQVAVERWSGCQPEAPATYTVSVRLGGHEIRTFSGTVTSQQDARHLFTVG